MHRQNSGVTVTGVDEGKQANTSPMQPSTAPVASTGVRSTRIRSRADEKIDAQQDRSSASKSEQSSGSYKRRKLNTAATATNTPMQPQFTLAASSAKAPKKLNLPDNILRYYGMLQTTTTSLRSSAKSIEQMRSSVIFQASIDELMKAPSDKQEDILWVIRRAISGRFPHEVTYLLKNFHTTLNNMGQKTLSSLYHLAMRNYSQVAMLLRIMLPKLDELLNDPADRARSPEIVKPVRRSQTTASTPRDHKGSLNDLQRSDTTPLTSSCSNRLRSNRDDRPLEEYSKLLISNRSSLNIFAYRNTQAFKDSIQALNVTNSPKDQQTVLRIISRAINYRCFQEVTYLLETFRTFLNSVNQMDLFRLYGLTLRRMTASVAEDLRVRLPALGEFLKDPANMDKIQQLSETLKTQIALKELQRAQFPDNTSAQIPSRREGHSSRSTSTQNNSSSSRLATGDVAVPDDSLFADGFNAWQNLQVQHRNLGADLLPLKINLPLPALRKRLSAKFKDTKLMSSINKAKKKFHISKHELENSTHTVMLQGPHLGAGQYRMAIDRKGIFRK